MDSKSFRQSLSKSRDLKSSSQFTKSKDTGNRPISAISVKHELKSKSIVSIIDQSSSRPGKLNLNTIIPVDSTSEFNLKQPTVTDRFRGSPGRSSIFQKKRQTAKPFFNKENLIEKTKFYEKVTVPPHLKQMANQQSLAKFEPEVDFWIKEEILQVYGGRKFQNVNRQSHESISSLNS